MDERKHKDGTRKPFKEYYCVGCMKVGKSGFLLETNSGGTIFLHNRDCFVKAVERVKKHGFDKDKSLIKHYGEFDVRVKIVLNRFDTKEFIRVIGKPKMMR